MQISSKFEFISGEFDTEKGKLVCVKSDKYKSVELCFRASMNIPFAEIKLYSGEKFIDAKQIYQDACHLGDEIVRRWNECETKK